MPSVVEREWAASSGEAWNYPWGDEPPGARACWRGKGSDIPDVNQWDTCPVGSHPSGASKQGILDLAGNVWEWLEDDAGSKKATRGGDSSMGGPEALTATCPGARKATVQETKLGFRCVRSANEGGGRK